MLNRPLQFTLSLLCLIIARPLIGAEAAAVIANKTVVSATISTHDLRSYILGQTPTWPNGQKVTVVLLPLSSPESKTVLKKICNMSEADFKRYFMQMAFEGKTVTAPRMAPSSAAAKAFVAGTPGAIAIIPAADADAKVSVVPIDGAAPGAANYKLAIE